ncbi:TetR/AcrR family transcriptional regulator [Homoserinibacter sp. YIM 151385]|uniref:TetR/AcrR family transcriptional regulator n=1 Tax=Homoserinibacter sp. YIM 151385 TaxID=2985506 RepID=UPI0022F073D2|nr:helix-turn-helix domain-containing protein [Homoserinibacter sp. YIM 151385]WBU37201.1 helix-turn-helix domain containing protein [Homoserinibacter sp. YIM 151385]
MSTGTAATPAEQGGRAASRMSAGERRPLILEAAVAVFGANGYSGTTTDLVASAAGVSQPYVVRMFGGKQRLFLEALDWAVDRISAAFVEAAGPAPDGGVHELGALQDRLSAAYVQLLEVRGLHLIVSQAFLLGGEPVIGDAARAHFARIWTLLREMGMSAQDVREFYAGGMLINTMVGLRLADSMDSDPEVTDMLRACFSGSLEEVAKTVPRPADAW